MPVRITAGDQANRKLTTSHDVRTADSEVSAKLFVERPDVRSGQGIDFHIFEAGDGVTLCGVKIPHSAKLKGHSDADAAMHALTDAILGAIGEADIGKHFPPSDPKWKGVASSIFLLKAVELLSARKGIIANADITILAEAPKIGPHIPAMKAVLAPLLQIAPDRIAIKATTTEEMGAIGRKEVSPPSPSPQFGSRCENRAGHRHRLCRAQLMIATAESCTGGLVAAAITDISGSSAVLDRGFVTYSNAAKMAMLGVASATLERSGAVSEQTAREMAVGALARSNAHVAVSITGIAGPNGGSPEKPVGLVHFACAVKTGAVAHVERRFGALTRSEIRSASVEQALQLLIAALR